MKPLLFILLIFTIGWWPIHAVGQDDIQNPERKNEVTVQWPTALYGKQRKAVSLAGVDIKSAFVLRNALDYHQALVKRDLKAIKHRTSTYLSYGHSNGWIESQADQLRNIETGYLIYHSYVEDSMTISYRYDDDLEATFSSQATKIIPQIQLDFIAVIDVSLQGKRNTYRLKVTEVWAPIPGGGKGCHLICRKASKL